jgi:hypothetical protein
MQQELDNLVQAVEQHNDWCYVKQER